MGKLMAAMEMVRFPWPEFELFGDQKSHFSKARYCATAYGNNFRSLKWNYGSFPNENSD